VEAPTALIGSVGILGGKDSLAASTRYGDAWICRGYTPFTVKSARSPLPTAKEHGVTDMPT